MTMRLQLVYQYRPSWQCICIDIYKVHVSNSGIWSKWERFLCNSNICEIKCYSLAHHTIPWHAVSGNIRVLKHTPTRHPSLSPTGFLNTYGGGAGGVVSNFALLDQIAALNWVAENINQFNGDPSRVTLFGRDTGAACISFLMESPIVPPGRLTSFLGILSLIYANWRYLSCLLVRSLSSTADRFLGISFFTLLWIVDVS